MKPQRTAVVILSTALALGLSACAGAVTTFSPADAEGDDWTYSEASGDAEYGAIWSSDGSRLILTWGSDGCGPRLKPIVVSTPTKLSVALQPTDRSCTAQELPFVAEVATPEGVDQFEPVELELPDGSTVIAPLP